MASKDKEKGDKSNTPSQKVLEGLLAMGVPKDQAEAVLQGTTAWLNQARSEGKQPESKSDSDIDDNGDKPFKEQDTRPLDIIRDQGRIDLVKLAVETKMSDGIEKMAPTSEVPSPMVMRMVRALSVDELLSDKCKDTPATVVALHFLLLMKACNRKGMKELVQLFEMSEEKIGVKDVFARDELGG